MRNDKVTGAFDRFFDGAKWIGADHFPSSAAWKADLERCLEFLSCHNQLARYKPRLIDIATRRDETMAEIRSAFFIDVLSGYPIKKWEPGGEGNALLEFSFLAENSEIQCEVKSPGWEREVVAVHGPESDRLQKPKYINNEVKFTGPWKDIRDCVKKAYPKFRACAPSILVINDDLFLSPLIIKPEIDVALFCPKTAGFDDGYLAEDGCFVGKEYENLGGVLFMQVNQYKDECVIYESKFVRNPQAKKECCINEKVRFPQSADFSRCFYA